MSEARARIRPVRQPPPHRYRFLAPGIALLACLAALGATLAGTFTVQHVDVVGRNLPVAAIVQTAGVEGDNIFSVRSDVIVQHVSSIPQIVVERVQTSFPDRVTIYARARVPMAAWQQAGGGLYLVDPEGRVIEQVRTTTLPVIVGAPGVALGPGIVAAVRYAVQQLPAEPRGAIAGFHVDPHLGLVILGKSGWTADAGRGTPQTLVNRVAVLASLLRTASNRSLKFVDLRYRVPYATFTGG